jgi:CHAD domain-containing protein
MSTTNPISVEPEVLSLTPQTPARLCARQLILERVRKLAQHEAGTRAGEDIEALHDMRVASRRLREALESFHFCFPPKIYTRLYERVRLVTRSLGQARNADVASTYFSELLSQSQDLVEQIALQDILRRQVKRQHKARTKMQKNLNKVQPSLLLTQFEKTFDKLAQRPGRQRGPRTALRLAQNLLAQRLREVFTRRRLITGEGDIEGMHNLRIALKKLRYTLEIFDFTAAEHAQDNLRLLKKLQTVIGDLHDCDVFAEIVQAQVSKLRKLEFTTHLLNGYQMLEAKIAAQRHVFYLNYLELFGHADIRDWRSRVMPPAPKKPRPVLRKKSPVVAEIAS